MNNANALYVLGHPVAHSKSPAMHNALYKALGLRWHYELMDCASADEASAFVRTGQYCGINITTPYKGAALDCAQEASARAVLAGGANVLVREGAEEVGEHATRAGKHPAAQSAQAGERVLHAYNVDGLGCVCYLERCGINFSKQRVVVCGSGPTSLSILEAVLHAGAPSVWLLGRDTQRTEGVLKKWHENLSRLKRAGERVAGAGEVFAGSYAQNPEAIAQATLIIDATPLGMCAGDPAPFDTTLLSAGMCVFDAVYGHGETSLARGAHAAHCDYLDGRGMLIAQAALSAQIFLQEGGINLPGGALDFDEAFAIMEGAAFS